MNTIKERIKYLSDLKTKSKKDNPKKIIKDIELLHESANKGAYPTLFNSDFFDELMKFLDDKIFIINTESLKNKGFDFYKNNSFFKKLNKGTLFFDNISGSSYIQVNEHTRGYSKFRNVPEFITTEEELDAIIKLYS